MYLAEHLEYLQPSEGDPDRLEAVQADPSEEMAQKEGVEADSTCLWIGQTPGCCLPADLDGRIDLPDSERHGRNHQRRASWKCQNSMVATQWMHLSVTRILEMTAFRA
jgi:hypothetical protein